MNDIVRIAIDGPAGAGKSTIAKLLAADMGIDYIDTGAMYRAIALKLSRTGTDYSDPEALAALLASTEVDYAGGKVFLDGEDVSGLIRTPEISELASASSAVLAVREKLAQIQREMGQRKSVIMDGRDITTKILPFAEHKFYLTASVDERAKRRALELQAKGLPCDLESVKADIEARDYRDTHRENSPLTVTEDSVVVDTTGLDIPEVLSLMKLEMEKGAAGRVKAAATDSTEKEDPTMNAIITVLGRDRVGILAAVCNRLAERNVNVLDVSQTILQSNFTMVMMVDVAKCSVSFKELAESLDELGRSMELSIRIQREEIFDAMHSI